MFFFFSSAFKHQQEKTSECKIVQFGGAIENNKFRYALQR